MLKMIIIDDEMIIRESLKHFINWESIDIEIEAVFPNGSKALDFILKDTPDIILSDINMPLLSGIELLEFLSHHKIASKVIFISAYSKFEYAQAALHLGAFDYILKPIDEEKLLQTVKKCYDVICRERQQITDFENLKKDSATRFLSLLKHMYYDEHYELSKADEELLAKNGFYSEHLRSMVSVGFWYNEECPLFQEHYRQLFDSLPYKTTVYAFSFENHLHAVLILSICENPETLYTDIEQILLKTDASFPNTVCGDISFSQPYPFHWQLDRMYTEISLAHILPTASTYISRFRDVMRQARRTLEGYTADPPEQPEANMIRNVRESLNRKFYQYICEGIIYEPNALKLDLIQFVDNSIKEIGEFQKQHKDLYNSALSSRKTINAQYSIDRIYEVTFHILTNLNAEMYQLHNRGITQFVRFTLDYIHEHYAENLSLTVIAEQLYVSPSYLSKIFSLEIGQPFSRYTLEYRIQKSVELLSDPHLKIYDIAMMCGFSDVAHFSKSFKQIMKVSPHKYRNQNL